LSGLARRVRAMSDQAALVIEPVTADRLRDLATLFGLNATTSGCYCTWFILPAKECKAGWSNGGNRSAFEALARAEPTPVGLLAYVDGEPVGWCAAGPRSRYARALRSTVLRSHDPSEDDDVWLVSCFFVRVGFRGQGIMRELLGRAVALASAHGASAVEGFPHTLEKRRGSGDIFVGIEPVFADCGFTVVDRPTASRVVMRLDVTRTGRTGTRRASGASRATTRPRRPQTSEE
jgi:GNAT superfamily N-acetyltransferase